MSPRRNQVKHVILSDEELETGVTTLDNIQAGVEEFHKHGITIFENAVPHDIIDKFYERMDADATRKLEDPNVFFNSGNEKNNFSISPPLSKEWLVEDIWANKHATAVMEAVFGLPQLVFAGSNINLPTTDPTSRQPVHVDSYAKHHDFPTCIELFLYLHDVSPANGVTELWPGSHREYDLKILAPHGRGWVKSSAFNRRAEHTPPIQPTIPKGSIAMRDLRVWHSGMPNLADHKRIMLGFIYFPRWYRSPMRINLPSSCRSIVQKWKHVDAIGATNFINEEIDNLDPKLGMLVSLNFTQDPATGIKQIREKIDLAQGREPPGVMLPVTPKDYWVPGMNKLSDRVTKIEVPKEKAKPKAKAKGKAKGKAKAKAKGKNDPLKPKSEGVKKTTKSPRTQSVKSVRLVE
ncbi:hypothetical protein NHQ30_003682 [Ciborinia camelliae]|nr:hypothetical protein NHQ30_003682 [Ciborinia camelliae]